MWMTKSEKKEQEKTLSEDEVKVKNKEQKEISLEEEESSEEKLKTLQEKLLRTMAEMENQRRRFEKEKKDAFEFGGFNFATESLSLLDNLERAVVSF